MSTKSDRRARQRERKREGLELAIEERWREAAEAYIHSRIVCERCGLEQAFAREADTPDEEGDGLVLLAPCESGLGCSSETAVWLDSFEIPEEVYSFAQTFGG